MAAKPLSAEKLKHYEKIILEELKESVAYLEDTHKNQSKGAKESSGDLSSYAYHQADQGSDTNLMEHTVMMMEQEREKIRQLNDALKRIYDGTYGLCEMCGEAIGEHGWNHPLRHTLRTCKEKLEDKKRKQNR